MKQNCSGVLAAAVLAGIAMSWASAAGAMTITLPDAIERALRAAPSIDIAGAANEMSNAHVREQRAPLFPSVGAGAEYYRSPGYSEAITNRGLSAGLLTLDYTAWDWGRRQARLRAAEYVSQASKLGVAAARAQIVFDTTIAYYDILRAWAAQRDLQASLDRMTRYVGTIESLQRSGRVIANDVLKVRAAHDSVELALAGAVSNSARASMILGALIGEPNQPELDVAPITGVPPKPVSDLAQSPVIQAAKRAIASANLQIKAAQAERLPTVQVGLTTGFLGIDPPATIRHNFGGSYDTVVSMPIFDGGLISSHIDQARAKEHSAIAQARQTEYILMRRIADALLRYDQALKQLEILTRAIPTAEDAFALTWTRFLGGGNLTMLEVLDSYQQAQQLRLQRFEQEFAAREAASEANLMYGRIQ